MMDKGFYLKEIYKFKNGEDYFGLDVRNALFFKMNKMTFQVIDTFPKHGELARGCDASMPGETIEALIKNGLLTPLPPAAGQISLDLLPINSMGLCLFNREKNELMALPVIKNAIDLLIQESGEKGNCHIVFITDDPDRSLEAVIDASEYAEIQGRKYNKNITFALRTSQFPFSSDSVRAAAARNMAVEIVFEGNLFRKDVDINITETLDEDAIRNLRRTFEPVADNTLITLTPDSKTISSLGIILDNLYGIGFRLIFLDILCPVCRGIVTAEELNLLHKAGAMKEYSLFSINKDQRKYGGLINIVQLIHTVLTGSKNYYGCRAGIDYMAVSPKGEIYPCHGMQENEGFKPGSIYDGPDKGLRKDLMLRHVENKEKCGGCGIRYFCGGGPVLTESQADPAGCELYRELSEDAMITFNELSLKQKTRIISLDKWMKRIMPYRGELSKNIRSGNITRRLTVTGSSMRPFLKEGDVVTVRPFDVEKVKMGDIVCFGKPATCHRVIGRYRENGRLVVLEKGDGHFAGSRIPVEEITGKVVNIRRGNRSVWVESKSGLLLNRLIGLVSLIVYRAGKMFAAGGMRR